MEYASGNIFIRPNRLRKGESCEEHMHEFDHTTFFVRGQFRALRFERAMRSPIEYATDKSGNPVWLLRDDRVFSAGQWCLIQKNMLHKFECLSDEGEFACIYAHRDPQSGEVVQDYNGWSKAYE